MSLKTKRNLNDLTNQNNERVNNNSAIDFNFDIGELKNEKSRSSSSSSESLIDDDDVFQDEQQNSMTSLSKTTNHHQIRKRLNGTSTYKNKRKTKFVKKENLLIDQTLNQLREEQIRIDAHSLSINLKL